VGDFFNLLKQVFNKLILFVLSNEFELLYSNILKPAQFNPLTSLVSEINVLKCNFNILKLPV